MYRLMYRLIMLARQDCRAFSVSRAPLEVYAVGGLPVNPFKQP